MIPRKAAPALQHSRQHFHCDWISADLAAHPECAPRVFFSLLSDFFLALDLTCQKMCVESDGCEIEGCSSSDEVRTLSGSMSPGLKSNPDLHPCKPGQKFRAALLKCRSPAAAAGILSFGNVLNYMDRYTVAGKWRDFSLSLRAV